MEPPDFTDDAASMTSHRGSWRDLFERLPLLPGTTNRGENRDYGAVEIEGPEESEIIQLARRNGGEGAGKRYAWRVWSAKEMVREVVIKPIGYLPAVVLGLLLNLLDAISYGTYASGNEW